MTAHFTARPALVLAARILRAHQPLLTADLAVVCSCGKWRQDTATPVQHPDHVAAQLAAAHLLAT